MAIVALSIGTIQSATAPGPLGNVAWIVNPVRLPAPLSDWITAMGAISNLSAPPIFLIAIAGVMARFRARVRLREAFERSWRSPERMGPYMSRSSHRGSPHHGVVVLRNFTPSEPTT